MNRFIHAFNETPSPHVGEGWGGGAWRIGLLGLLALLLPGAVLAQLACPSAADQARAAALYEQARAQSGTAAALPLLRESIAICPQFQNQAELAYTLLALKRHAEAEAAAHEAVNRAASPANAVMGWWLLAQAREGQGQWADAKLAYETAIHRVTGPPPAELLDSLAAFEEALAARGGLRAAELEKALRATRAPEAVPRIAVRIEFDYDSAALTAAGRAQVGELAKALQAAGTREYRVRLVGHTDARGTRDYNQALSERRARAVVAELTRLDAALADRLDAEGRGKDRLRVPDAQTEAHHAVNRRVEVELGRRR